MFVSIMPSVIPSFTRQKTKSEKELETEKSWNGSDKVWLVHQSGFSSGAVSSKPKDAEEEEGGGVDVTLDHGGQVIEKIDQVSIEKVCVLCISLIALFIYYVLFITLTLPQPINTTLNMALPEADLEVRQTTA